MLRLPTIRARFPDLADEAAAEQMSYRGFLAELLMAECDDRARRRAARRIKAAGFPVINRCGPGTLVPIPTSTLLRCTPWPSANGSKRVCPCV